MSLSDEQIAEVYELLDMCTCLYLYNLMFESWLHEAYQMIYIGKDGQGNEMFDFNIKPSEYFQVVKIFLEYFPVED